VLRNTAARDLHQKEWDHQDGYNRQPQAPRGGIHRASCAALPIPPGHELTPLAAISGGHMAYHSAATALATQLPTVRSR
jgi:hypothetical protein